MLSSLSVSLGGAVLPSNLIKYAGVTPGCVGLYQLNIELPQNVGADPAIQVAWARNRTPEHSKSRSNRFLSATIWPAAR